MVIIDFTVNRIWPKEKLLGVVINQEKAELEETLNALMSDINQNVARLKNLDDKLLETHAAADMEKILEDKNSLIYCRKWERVQEGRVDDQECRREQNLD